MPNENDTKPAAPAAPAPVADPRDAQLADLVKQVAHLKERLKEKPRNTVPAGDYCVLGGKTYEVLGTVATRHATDEGRKGNIDLEGELVIVKR
jgi:hypothetical protein